MDVEVVKYEEIYEDKVIKNVEYECMYFELESIEERLSKPRYNEGYDEREDKENTCFATIKGYGDEYDNILVVVQRCMEIKYVAMEVSKEI